MISVRIRLYYTSKAVVRLFTGSIYTLSLGCRVTLMGFVRVWYRHCGVGGVPLCGGCLVRELCGVDVPNHIVCVFHSINLSVHTFHRMFPVSLNITLKQFHDITNICGYIPCPCFKATLSLNALFSATCNTIVAIEETKKLVVTIANVHNGQSIYCAFEIISLPQE